MNCNFRNDNLIKLGKDKISSFISPLANHFAFLFLIDFLKVK